MLLANLVLLQCIITSAGARESGHVNAEEQGLALAEHPATDNAPNAKTTTHPVSFTEIHGWSSLERATPLSIGTLAAQ